MPKEYIDRDKLIKGAELCRETTDAFIEIIKDQPAADVREVVLCWDCKWCHSGYCEKYDDIIPFGYADRPWEDWFCADGVNGGRGDANYCPNCGAEMKGEAD